MNWIKQRWARLCSAMSFVLTSLSALPYDIGAMSVWISPRLKPAAFVVGAVLFVIFQLIQRQKPKVEETPKPQVIHIHHHYDKGEIT